MSGRDLHRGGTVVMALAMIAIGVALIVEAALGGGILSLLTLVGIFFLAAGAGRLYVESRRGRGA